MKLTSEEIEPRAKFVEVHIKAYATVIVATDPDNSDDTAKQSALELACSEIRMGDLQLDCGEAMRIIPLNEVRNEIRWSEKFVDLQPQDQ